MLKFEVVLLSLALFRPIAAERIKCEMIEVENWTIGDVKTCEMNGTTSITTAETKIDEPKDEIMEAINFHDNDKINFLPIEIYKVFPNLRLMNVFSCSLRTISKRNFEKLDKLEKLYLDHNQIEKIPTDAFEDLKSLKILWLQLNKIKFLNGQAFDGLANLNVVWLTENVCINKRFDGAEAIAVLKSEVDEKCGFQDHEAWKKISELQTTVAKLLDQMKETNEKYDVVSKKNGKLEININELTQKNSELSTENLALKRENAELELKLGDSRTKNAELETKNESLTKEIGELRTETIDLRTKNVIFESKNAELTSAIDGKSKEISRQASKISEMSTKNSECESKVAATKEEAESIRNDLKNCENPV